MVEAMFYKKLKNKKVQCHLCPHQCEIVSGKVGICNVRKNESGTLYAKAYGKISSYALDPIEKKPLKRYKPHEYIFSIGSYGCNFRCSFCQNYQIALETPETMDLSPEQLIAKAKSYSKSIGIAYTYNEPLINYEYVYDSAQLAKEEGLKNVLVTNGFIETEPLKKLLPFIDAMNIDLKAFTNSFYQSICKGKLSPIKETIRTAYNSQTHIEITLLLIEGLNDDFEDLEEMFQWIASLDEEIPLHISRYFPCYQMQRPPTRLQRLMTVDDLAKKYLKYVYLGNV